MRIAIVNAQDWIQGGMDKVALVHYEALRQAGHQVAFFARQDPRNLETPYRKYYPLETDRQHYRLDWRRLHRLPTDAMKCLYNNEAAHRMDAFLEDFQPDLVHVHGLTRSLSASLYDPIKTRGIPLIQTHHYVKLVCPNGRLLKGDVQYCHEMPCLHGNPLSCIRHRCQQRSVARSLLSALEFRVNRTRYLEKPDHHLAPSHYLKELLARAGVAPERLSLHPNFVDTSIFTAPDSAHTMETYFLYFGRLSPEKGIETMIEAFAHLPRLCGRPWRLYLAGEGPLKAQCQERIAQEGWDHIVCLGHQDERQLVQLIQGARATLLPATWGEIFGLSILESFACGRPVIGSRVGAIPELIEDGENGYLVEPGDVASLQDALVRMANQPQSEVIAMGQAGLKKVLSRFTLEHHIGQLLDFYATTLNRPQPRKIPTHV